MAQSMLRHPPRNSELGLRLAHLIDPIALKAFYQADTAACEIAEAVAFRDDPRQWKAPLPAVARFGLPGYLGVVAGPEAAAEFDRCSERLKLCLAELYQALEKSEAKAEDRNRDVVPDHRWMLRCLIVAEMISVNEAMPAASVTARRRETGRRLGAANEPVNTATIRRATQAHADETARLLLPLRIGMLQYLILLNDYFRAGWQTRVRAGSEDAARVRLMALGQALVFWLGPTAPPDFQDLTAVELHRRFALGSTEPAAETVGINHSRRL
jgi:hypothetical protein